MELEQLRSFIAVADELHFGRAAQRLDMLPSSLSRHIRLLEEDLSTRLLTRTTRSVALTEDGETLVEEARALIARADGIATRLRERRRARATTLRVGAIDSAAAGLMPQLLREFRQRRPDVVVRLVEDKSIRLLPRLLSGGLDLAFVRPPVKPDKRLALEPLLHKSAVVALPARHRLAARRRLGIDDLDGEPLIVPDRRSRPHSHDLTIKLFQEAGLRPVVGQIAEEKQTIVTLVAVGLGVAIVPRWTSRMAISGVRYVPLKVAGADPMHKLPLVAAWSRGSRDEIRDDLLAMLRARLGAYARQA